MIRLDPQGWHSIADEMNAASVASVVAKKHAGRLGCATFTVFRNAKKYGYDSGKKTRSDKGSSNIDPNIRIMAAEILANSQRKNGKILGTAENTIRLLENNGYIQPGTVTAANLNRLLRQDGISKRDLSAPEPTVKMRSKYPNHVHSLDATVWFQYFDRHGKIGHRCVSRTLYKNKMRNLRALVKVPHYHLFTLTDHYSGATWARFYYVAGEDTESILDLLWRCWSPKDEPGLAPFCGVPEILFTDNGPAIKSKIMKRFFDRFDVRHEAHMPYRPWVKGQVEQAHNNIEMGLGANAIEEPARDVDQLNNYLDKWLRNFNATAVHTRHGNARFPFWATHVGDNLRLPPADLETFKMCALSAPETRRVQNDRTISFEGRDKVYIINHPAFLPGDEITVEYSPFDYPDIIVENKSRNTEKIKLKAIQKDVAGFPADMPFIGEGYKSRKHSITMRARKKMAEARERIDAAGGLKAHEYPDTNVEQFQPHRRAPEIEIEAPVIPSIPKRDAIADLGERLVGDVPLDAETIETINTAWAGLDTITPAQLEELFAILTADDEAEAIA